GGGGPIAVDVLVGRRGEVDLDEFRQREQRRRPDRRDHVIERDLVAALHQQLAGGRDPHLFAWLAGHLKNDFVGRQQLDDLVLQKRQRRADERAPLVGQFFETNRQERVRDHAGGRL